jgi:cytochrome P450
MSTAPGPAGHWLLGSLPERRSNPIGFFTSSAREFGPVIGYRMGPKAVMQVAHPEAIRHVFLENHKNYIKGFGYDKLEPILGKGLLTSEGDFWRRQRKLAQPAFHRPRLAALVADIVGMGHELLARWEPMANRPVAPDTILDLSHEMTRFALKVASVTLLGKDVSDHAGRVGQALGRLLELANDQITSVFTVPQSIPTPGVLRFRKDRDLLNSVVFGIIDERRKQLAQGQAPQNHDLLAMLMDLKDEDTGEKMSDAQLRDEVMTIFLAGHETTANLLTWTLMLLSQHPDAYARLTAEVDQVLAGRAPTFEDLGKLRYTLMVLEESLRLYPPAWVLSRQAVGDDEVLGFRIPKRTIVVASPYVMHHHPHYWENPEGFRPERFDPANPEEATKNKFVYFPFGAGPRYCIGKDFALIEAQIVLAMIVSKYRVDVVPGQTLVPEPLITLRPRDGIWVNLRKRAAR